MGLLSRLKEKVQAEQSFGRVSESADLGIDVRHKKTMKTFPKETQGGLFESKEEARARNKRKAQEVYGKIQSGYAKYEKGKKQVGKMFHDLGSLLPDEPKSRGRRSSSSSGFGISDSDLRELQGLGGGNPFGGSNRPRRKTSGKKGYLPIYRGKRIIGYTTKGRSKRKAKRDPWDLDLGF